MIQTGKPYYIVGPLDITIGVVEACDGITIRMGECVTSRLINSEQHTTDTGTPSRDDEYVVHKPGTRTIQSLSVTGWTELLKFDPKDWPKRT